MQIHRIPIHDREFFMMANKAIQDRRMSHTARGILALVISLPSGIQENVRTLSDDYPQGRSSVAAAVAELRRLGYWVTETLRDPETQQIFSTVDVYELPTLRDMEPVPTRPVTGPVATGDPGTSPFGEKDLGKDGGKTPPSPPARELAEQPEDEPGREASMAPRKDPGIRPTEPKEPTEPTDPARPTAQPEPTPAFAATPEPARILRRLEAIDPRLRLSDRQIARLAPPVADWLERGATTAEITDALTQGLPQKLYSAAAVIADRLDRKRPARKRRWKTYADCDNGCGGLLPADQDSGICAICAGVQPPPAQAPASRPQKPSGPLSPRGFAAFRAARQALLQQPSA
ncbi:hypothetical protein HHL19_29645 [Streptomyces sp. R302]|uniref:hypothetical protein n=1 Tax=unclassified Streptomyces TaxID=2593676 RepID=UPI00145F1A5B|nr:MULTISPECIES: hypothetical protein [unclassified Streptomyces]NML55289.1 hypothetical protein [Streptomyces sp. R301]NML82709.1 hypothetical protein [Streptomyces sp. R302]